jgi:hypothetical protein
VVEEARYGLVLVATALCGCSLIDAARESAETRDRAAPDGGGPGAPTDAATGCGVADDFEDGVTGAGWVAFDDDDAAVAETGGVLRVSFTGTAEAWAGYDLRDRIDLTDGEVRVEIGLAGGAYTGFDVCFGGMELELYADDAETLVGEVAGTDSFDDWSEIEYQPAIHRIWRIRSAEGVVYWEVSETGAEWETIHSQAAPFPLDDVTVTVEAGGVTGDAAAAFESFAAMPAGCAQ